MTEQTDEVQNLVPAPAEQQPQQPASLPINDDDTLGFSGCGFGAVCE
jgi:hypothetical protein